MSTVEKESELQEVKSFFDGYATDFDSIYGHTNNRGLIDKISDKLFRQSMYLRYQECLKNTAQKQVTSILDIGCGSGHYCEAYLNQGKIVTGLDIAEGMLKIARQKTDKYIKEGKANYILADYLSHTFTSKFDVACLMGFFDYIRDPEAIFLKLEKDVSKEIYMSFPKKGGFLAWQRKIRYNMKNCPLYFYTKEDLIAILKRVKWEGKAEIIDLGRDYFVKVKLA
jgi:predicted TPR repeat methyltransferase